MTRRLLQIVLVGAIALGASSASALMQREPEKVTYEKVTVINICDVTLEAELQRGALENVVVRRKTKFGSHIQLRAHFNPELERSVSSL